MKRYLLIAALAIFTVLSCSREEPAVRGGGEVTISFRTCGAYARSTVPGDGDPADGGGIYISGGVPDLVILIANSGGAIEGVYPGSGSILQDNPASTELSVTFSGLTTGTHTAYAFANMEDCPWDLSTGGSPVTDLTSLTTAAQVEALQFGPFAANTAPEIENGRMPLSGKGTFEVSGTGNGEVSLELLRCVAKISMEFVNNTGASLSLDDFDFALKNLCPDRGFAAPHTLPELPAGITYGNVVKNVGDGTVLNASGTGSSVKYEFLVFPGVAVPRSRDYTLDVAFRANGAASVKDYDDLPIHDNRAVDIVSLERNQHLHIVTKISMGLTVSFNFEVVPWKPMTEQVLFE